MGSKAKYRKKNRSGNPITISLFKAFDRLVQDYGDKIDSSVRQNLDALVEIRDNSVHFMNKDLDLEKRIHEIGSASIKNYFNITRQWFAKDLSEYHLFLMPLAYINMQQSNFEGLNLNAQEKHLLNYLNQIKNDDPSKDFNNALKIQISVKKTKDQNAIKVVQSNSPEAIPVKIDEESKREEFPWTYDNLRAQLKKRYTDFKQDKKFHRIRKQLEQDEKLCSVRYLDPGNMNSSKKNFYSSNILKSFDCNYQKKESNQ